jgi:Zn-dependent peptidase ImmA (M78 family)
MSSHPMDDDLRMKLADLGSPEALADCIVDHFSDIEIPIPLERIANTVGIVEVIAQTTDRFEGVLITDASKTKGSIAYNNSSRLERRRFTIAHEMGHFLLPLHGAGAQCVKADMGVLASKDANRAREAEANRFAVSLLLPKKLFVRDMRQLRSPAIEHILKLADDYQVSKEATARRYMDLSDHTCAVIFSHRGKLRYSLRTRDFPFIAIRADQALPSNSISACVKCEPGQLSEWSEAASEFWIGDSNRLGGKVLYEQYLDQANGYRMSMLLIDDIVEESEADEDEQLEESWRPKFRR